MKIDYKIGDIERKIEDPYYQWDMLGKGSRGSIIRWWRRRQIMKTDRYATDVQILKMLFGGKGLIANPELICFSNNGKMITDKMMDFLRLDERHFQTDRIVRLFVGDTIIDELMRDGV